MKILAILTLLLCSAPLYARDEVWDAADYFRQTSDPVTTEEHALESSPLWPNAPFLKLRAGDAVFVAQNWQEGGKGQPGFLVSPASVFLQTDGHTYKVGTVEKSGVRLSAGASIFFNWELSLKNAQALRKLRGDLGGVPLTTAQATAIVAAIRADFPGAVREKATPQIIPAHLEGEGKTRRAVFETLRYSPDRHTIEKERTEIAPGMFRVTLHPFVVGPDKVTQFDLDSNDFGGPNRSGHLYTREEFAKSRLFESLVETVLPQLKRSETGGVSTQLTQ